MTVTAYHDPDCQLGCVYECPCDPDCAECAPTLAAFAAEDRLELVRNTAIALIQEVWFSDDGGVAPNVDLDGRATAPELWRALRDALIVESLGRR